MNLLVSDNMNDEHLAVVNAQMIVEVLVEPVGTVEKGVTNGDHVLSQKEVHQIMVGVKAIIL